MQPGRPREASIIVNAYQQAATLALSLHALSQQDFDGEWEMVIIDGTTLLFLDGDMVPNHDLPRIHLTGQQRPPVVLAGNRLWRNPSADLGGTSTADRPVLQPGGRWQAVPHGQGADKSRTLALALDWDATRTSAAR